MRAFLELPAALKGTIVVALRRARPTTLAIGGAVAVLVLGALVVALGGAGGGGDDDLADSRGGSGSGATVEETTPSASDPEAVDPDARPLIDGVATRPPTDPGGGGTDGTPDGVAVADGGDALLDVGAPARGELTAPPAATGPDTSPESTSTSAVEVDSSTTTEGSTTTTTADPGSSSSGGLLAGVLDLLGLG